MPKQTVLVRKPPANASLPTHVTKVLVADSFMTRLIGLLNRAHLPDHEAILISPCSSIHTFCMRFSIDLVFLDHENRVLGTSVGVKPNRVRVGPKGTKRILEVAEGNVTRTGIHLDDILIFD